MKWSEIIRQSLVDGGPATCQFAVTNVCNAKCDFCSFAVDKLPREERQMAPTEESLQALEILRRNGVGFVVFTGGEPMVHRDLPRLMARARDLDMMSMMVTNGSVLLPDRIEELASVGLKSVIMSIDAAEAELHEGNRGLRGVCARIREANAHFRRLGIGTTASVTLSRLLTDFDALPPFLESLGFESLTFSFPLTGLESSYLGYASSSLVDFTPQEMHDLIERVRRLKKRFRVLNPSASLDDMHLHLDRLPERFECLGGYKQFYLDWNLMLWRCNNWKTPMCHIRDFDGSQRVRDGCTACMVDCYRDASVLQHVAVSVSDGLRSLGRGDVGRSARQIFNRSNLISIQAVLESSYWVKRI